jgi:hypothetical protein
MIIGGIAVMVRGVPRQTVDIDATVWGEGTSVESLAAALARHGIVGRIPDALEFARTRQVLLLRHDPTGTPLEVSLAWLPFEREALERATVEDIAGVRIKVARPEDLVVFKAVAWRERDRTDIERLLVLHGSAMDLGRVKRLVREFSEVLDSPERVEEFAAIVRRATDT